jgi:hypothetical protein
MIGVTEYPALGRRIVTGAVMQGWMLMPIGGPACGGGEIVTTADHLTECGQCLHDQAG